MAIESIDGRIMAHYKLIMEHILKQQDAHSHRKSLHRLKDRVMGVNPLTIFPEEVSSRATDVTTG